MNPSVWVHNGGPREPRRGFILGGPPEATLEAQPAAPRWRQSTNLVEVILEITRLDNVYVVCHAPRKDAQQSPKCAGKFTGIPGNRLRNHSARPRSLETTSADRKFFPFLRFFCVQVLPYKGLPELQNGFPEL